MTHDHLAFTGEQSLDLLNRWISQYGLSYALAARALGVSRRTVIRWQSLGRAPVHVAHTIDQLEHGAWLRSHVKRGAWAAGRDNLVRDLMFGRRTGPATASD